LLTLILAESSLETIPEKLWSHPSIVKFAESKGKSPEFILLDRSYHHHVMIRLEESEKRGRPDIVHRSLLIALDSPLNREGLLRVFVHTLNDSVVTVQPETRLPRNYNRFIGLIEQLFQLGSVPPEGETLLKIEKKTLEALLEELDPDRIIGFSQSGIPQTIKETISNLKGKKNICFLIGGFPHGDFSEETRRLFDEEVSIDKEGLDASTVVSRVIYEYEVAYGLPKKRLRR